MPAPLADPFYYLANFQRVLDWLAARYDDLLQPEEHAFIAGFAALPTPSQALLVRMIMRKGELFRTTRLNYAEIGETTGALSPLLEAGWVQDAPLLDLDALFSLFTLAELQRLFNAPRGLSKQALRTSRGDEPARSLSQWWPGQQERVCALRLMPLCDRLRLMFFGNLRQDWSTFVLADLGLHRYEQVALHEEARGFGSRRDLDDYLQLHACRDAFEAGEAVAQVLARLPDSPLANPWIERRRGRLLLQLGQHCERLGEWQRALDLHRRSCEPEARIRELRVLERQDEHAAALQAAERLVDAALPDAQHQQLQRLLPRLRRRLGLPPSPTPPRVPTQRLDLCLPRGEQPGVEWAVREHLHTPQTPVFFLENALLNSLFGLLCWEAIFAPLPGAFFHPYHLAPEDLHASDFHARRAALFQTCLARLDDGSHAQAIRATYEAKHGILSPFVHWEALDREILELALTCLPPAHLRACFERLLRDIRANRAGMPDLVQFLPEQRSYRLIEVKGPGDRLQDNQKRWLAFCAEQEIPVQVCYLRWAEPA